jgi:hypothetical protein
MKAILTGVVHGKTIQLDRDSGFADGQPVSVTMHPLPAGREQLTPGEGIKGAAGAWSDDPDGLDAYLEWNRQQRKLWRSPVDR